MLWQTHEQIEGRMDEKTERERQRNRQTDRQLSDNIKILGFESHKDFVD